ncbi:hypothetical protein TNIN_261701 [Trichonephila inaurata madagascariensis]|uniref:Uncharacterized protein n=1 Tax=Trichonephila inaurata madagascariensis TaxID=2747483 RepID=A0A8X6XBG1_9ARAC|nr:hypothetical protein TNIN_261701 [Trichonephila inaurata madagascariensis]
MCQVLNEDSCTQIDGCQDPLKSISDVKIDDQNFSILQLMDQEGLPPNPVTVTENFAQKSLLLSSQGSSILRDHTT